MSDYIDFDSVPRRLEDIEDLYSILYKSEKNIGLLLPTNIGSSKLGIKTSLCQFINTWFRYTSDEAKLYSYITSESDIENQLANFCNQFHGLVAIGMASSNRKIVTRTKSIEFSQKAEKVLEQRMNKMQGVQKGSKLVFDEKPGRPLMLICFDHMKSDKHKFLNWLYEYDSRARKYLVRNIKDFKSLFWKISQTIWIQRLNEIKKMETLDEALGGIMEELFKNTHDWARNDFGARKSEFLTPNMRGIFTEVHHGSKGHFQRVAEGSKPLERYFNHPIFFTKNTEEQKLSFLEVSILDSGCGYSQVKSGEKITDHKALKKEFDDIIDCLAKYETSSESIESRIRGRGLKRVSRLCGSRGFFKIRTGRLCVYRDFVTDPYNPMKIDPAEYIEETSTIKSYIKDWVNCNENLTKLHFAEGSLITIYYPLKFEVEASEQLTLQL